MPENAKTSDEVAPVIPEQLSNEDITLHGIADFLNKMSKRDKVLMKNMHKVAQNNTHWLTNVTRWQTKTYRPSP